MSSSPAPGAPDEEMTHAAETAAGARQLLLRLSEASGLTPDGILQQALRLWSQTHGYEEQDHSAGPSADEPAQGCKVDAAGPAESGRQVLGKRQTPPAGDGGEDDDDDDDEGTPGSRDWEKGEMSPVLPAIFSLLEDSSHLSAARLVCRSWDRQVLEAKLKSFTLTRSSHFGSPQCVRTLSKCDGLQSLTMDIRPIVPPESVATVSLIASGLPKLRELRLHSVQLLPRSLRPLEPLLPRLDSLWLASRGNQLAPGELGAALALATQLTRLQISLRGDASEGDQADPIAGPPASLLGALPQTLRSLHLTHVAFGENESLASLAFCASLTDLFIIRCSFQGPMGLLSLVNLRRLTVSLWVIIKPGDLDDILTLQRLEHLDLKGNITDSFVLGLPDSLPDLCSLTLIDWQGIADHLLQPLGSLTGLTALHLEAEEEGPSTEHLTASGLQHLSALTQLEKLTLGHHRQQRLVPDGLPHLQALSALTSLDLIDCRFDPGCVPLLPDGLRHLGLALSLRGEEEDGLEAEHSESSVSSTVLALLPDHCRALTSVDLSYCYGVSVQNLYHLSRLAHLEKITLDESDGFGVLDHQLMEVEASVGHLLDRGRAIVDGILQAMPLLKLSQDDIPRHYPWEHNINHVSARQDQRDCIARDLRRLKDYFNTVQV